MYYIQERFDEDLLTIQKQRHTGPDVEVFRARLIGAKEPYNYFAIESHPGI